MFTNIEIIKKVVNDIFIFALIWEIDETNADDTFKIIFDSFYWNKIIYDLSKMEYCNSKFIWYIVNMNEFIQEKWWKMCISITENPVKDTLDLAWVHHFIPIKDSVEEAILEINNEIWNIA